MRKSFKIIVLLGFLIMIGVGCASAEVAEPTASPPTAESTTEPTPTPKPISTTKPTTVPATITPTIEPTLKVTLTEEEIVEAFFEALRTDDATSISNLIEAGADPNHVDKNSSLTPIMIATVRDAPEVVSLLLEAGADTSIIDRGNNTPLHHAAFNNSVAAAEILLAQPDIELEIERSTYGFTPLLVAAFEGNLEIVELLVAHGANIEAQDDWNDTPLNVASWNGNYDVVEKLVELGANPDVVNTQGNNALDHAQSQGHEEIEALLSTTQEG